MGGVRTSGDLVARMMMQKRMRLPEAKKYVADKLGIQENEMWKMTDEIFMGEKRVELGLGGVYGGQGAKAKGIESKINISRLLDLKINSVEKFKKFAGVEFC